MKPNNAMKLLGVVGVTTATAFMGMGEAKAAVIAIDTFEVEQTFGPVSNDVQTTDTVNQSDAGLTNSILGGTRETTFEVEAGSTSFGDQASLAIGNQSRVLSIRESGDLNVKANLLFDEGGSGFNNGNGIDITSGGDNTGVLFENLDTRGNDEVEIFLTLTDTDGDLSTIGGTFSDIQDQNVFLNFSNLDASLNQDKIFSANLFTSSVGTDNSIDYEAFGFAPNIDSSIPSGDPEAEAVPFEAETSVALAFLGAFGAWKYWKRRKEQQLNFDNTEA